MTFATYQDLEDRLRVTFTAPEQVQATALLDAATAVVQAAAGQLIEQDTNDTVTLDGNDGTILQLPQIPVTSVASVTVDGTALVSGDEFLWNGPQGLLYRTSDGAWSRWGTTWGTKPQSIVVVYTHGYAAIPADVTAVTVEVAARAWSTPAGAVRQESIGSYSVTYDTRALEAAGLALTATERTIVARFGALAFA